MHGSAHALNALGTSAPPRTERDEASEALLSWLRTELSVWNADLLATRRTPAEFREELQSRLVDLGSPLECSVNDCRRLIVMLGMAGSALERHSQEAGAPAGAALRGLRAGRTGFRRYVATLAARAGGPPRDSFLSYVMWNMPAVAVYLPGELTASLVVPGVFGAAPPITFSGAEPELMFLGLLKRCGALEHMANDQILPVCEGELAPDDPVAVANVERAGLLLRAVRAEMRVFMGRPEFTPEIMLDELRQYACPWDDIDTYHAPSGGHDTAFIVRDRLLGVPIPGYDDHVLEQFNVLDASGQRDVLAALTLTPLDERIRSAAGVSDLHDLDAAEAADVLNRCPWLSSYVRLYQANAAVGATHWAMIMKYMIIPMRQRDYDAVVVSNHAGTTHMWMDTLRVYTDARNDHPLAGLRHAARQSDGVSAGGQVRAVLPIDAEATHDPGADAAVRAVYEMAEQHNAGDLDGTRRFYTDDVVWHVQGSNQTTGDFVGIDALFEYFATAQRITENTLQLHPQTVTVSGDLVGVLMRVTAQRADGRVMDTLLAQTRRVTADGRWSEYWAVADDQDALDAFWG